MVTLPGLRGKVLLTTRLRPASAETRGGILLQGCREEELLQLYPADAVAFFRMQGVRGLRAEIEDACERYGYHPLSLRLLVGLIVSDLQQPGDIAAARRLDVSGDLIQQRHHVLEQSYASLLPQRQHLLSRIACFRTPVDYDALKTLGKMEGIEISVDADLLDLVSRGLLHRDRRRNRFDLHPIVRRYAYDRLTLAARAKAHADLRDYFEAIPRAAKVETLDDLMPVIELFHHTARAGQYDDAFDLLMDRLYAPLYFQFGAYDVLADLLRALFPDGEDEAPRIRDRETESRPNPARKLLQRPRPASLGGRVGQASDHGLRYGRREEPSRSIQPWNPTGIHR